MGKPAHFLLPFQIGTPRLHPEDHMGLIDALKSLTPLAEVHVVKLNGMSKFKRIELLNRACVCFSLRSLRREMIRLI